MPSLQNVDANPAHTFAEGIRGAERWPASQRKFHRPVTYAGAYKRTSVNCTPGSEKRSHIEGISASVRGRRTRFRVGSPRSSIPSVSRSGGRATRTLIPAPGVAQSLDFASSSARRNTHVLSDETELDYRARRLASSRDRRPRLELRWLRRSAAGHRGGQGRIRRAT